METILSNNIKNFRKKLALSQEKLAEYIGISREEFNYYENGKREIPHNLVPKLANLFGVDEYDLYEKDDCINETNMAFAFRAGELENEDLCSIASFKKIALNYLMLKNQIVKTNE